jgi:hypothetical protein
MTHLLLTLLIAAATGRDGCPINDTSLRAAVRTAPAEMSTHTNGEAVARFTQLRSCIEDAEPIYLESRRPGLTEHQIEALRAAIGTITDANSATAEAVAGSGSSLGRMADEQRMTGELAILRALRNEGPPTTRRAAGVRARYDAASTSVPAAVRQQMDGALATFDRAITSLGARARGPLIDWLDHTIR